MNVLHPALSLITALRYSIENIFLRGVIITLTNAANLPNKKKQNF